MTSELVRKRAVIAFVPLLLISIWNVGCRHPARADILLEANVSPTKRIYVMQAPVELSLTLANKSDSTLYSGIEFPSRMGLSFATEQPDDSVKAVPAEDQHLGLFEMQKFVVGIPYQRKIFLNRYLNFTRPGEYDIAYSLTLLFFTRDANGKLSASYEKIVKKGVIHFTIRPSDPAELDHVLASQAEGLNSKFSKRRAESIEAFAFLESPVAVKYWRKMLKMRGAEFVAISGLSAFDSGKYVSAIADVFPTSNPNVIQSALEALKKAKVALGKDIIRQILSQTYFGNDLPKLCAAQYMAAIGSVDYEPILRSLTLDGNSEVANAAKQGLSAVQRTSQ